MKKTYFAIQNFKNMTLHDRFWRDLPVDCRAEEGFKCESLHDSSII